MPWMQRQPQALTTKPIHVHATIPVRCLARSVVCGNINTPPLIEDRIRLSGFCVNFRDSLFVPLCSTYTGTTPLISAPNQNFLTIPPPPSYPNSLSLPPTHTLTTTPHGIIFFFSIQKLSTFVTPLLIQYKQRRGVH